MVANVACSSPGCTNPVIGQCGGYKRSCGSFYCAVHSKDKLCSECSERKTQDDLVEEYYQLAQHVEKFPKQETDKMGLPLRILGTAMLCLPCPAFYYFQYLSDTQGIKLNATLLIGILLLMPLGAMVAIIFGIYIAITQSKMRKKIIEDIVATKPNFPEFYEIYKSERRKEKLQMAGSIAMGLIAAAAADVQKSYERQRKEEMIRKAVDDELNRHGM
jgi:hypothetical protein